MTQERKIRRKDLYEMVRRFVDGDFDKKSSRDGAFVKLNDDEFCVYNGAGRALNPGDPVVVTHAHLWGLNYYQAFDIVYRKACCLYGNAPLGEVDEAPITLTTAIKDKHIGKCKLSEGVFFAPVQYVFEGDVVSDETFRRYAKLNASGYYEGIADHTQEEKGTVLYLIQDASLPEPGVDGKPYCVCLLIKSAVTGGEEEETSGTPCVIWVDNERGNWKP
ncbi:MAG: hypothetical protein IKY61_07110, partial [Thermoguttaceae bacterium]|nr:hypothetical protein [Thermoguttaceae bacterium]